MYILREEILSSIYPMMILDLDIFEVTYSPIWRILC